MKARQEVPSVKVGYRQQQENKKRMKEELKALKEMLKKGPENKTARDLGLHVEGQGESRIIINNCLRDCSCTLSLPVKVRCDVSMGTVPVIHTE